jgi:DNA-binding NarL/FixJ family response regulator
MGNPTRDPVTHLTPREFEVAKSLALGRSGAEIAKALDISIKTVSTHREHVLRHTGTRNNVELARHALRMKWVEL